MNTPKKGISWTCNQQVYRKLNTNSKSTVHIEISDQMAKSEENSYQNGNKKHNLTSPRQPWKKLESKQKHVKERCHTCGARAWKGSGSLQNNRKKRLQI